MTGGVSYIYRLKENGRNNLNTDLVRAVELTSVDEELVYNLLRQHHFRTGSVMADSIVQNWDGEKILFGKIVPTALDKIDFKNVYDEQMALRVGTVLHQ